MQIKLNSNVDPVVNVPQGASKAPAGSSAADPASFAQAERLDQVLATSPDTRAAAVASAKQLIAQSSYPPPETIDKIAALLATHLEL